ncbi:hypothetical protein [Alteraurantiacibacter buctensis]|uniref:Uncharacterized protein n=1 Tax=Alteraurantiacibacter buctensis TaxID=1503981 RepID=A0A844YUS3_9SPHN|nr:hypothetical protein [Alteraurantiacibacter buctensis]MXO70766.1 hypothetical protein [Alteraurantiacibacter buctensis]
MPLVEVYEGDDDSQLLVTADFDFLPRVGEYISHDAGDYFRYYDVVEVWHRAEPGNARFRACARVVLRD